MGEARTRTQPFERSHSSNSLPPPVLNRRRESRARAPLGFRFSGYRRVNVRVSTFDG